MLVNTVDRESVELIERSHPLRVTLSQIVVDGDHVHTVAGQGIEEHGQGTHKGLTLTCGHLGDLTLMEGDTTEELHVVVDHVPFDLVATGCPLIVIDGLVAIDGDEVVSRISSELTVEIRSGDHSFLVLGEAACRVLDNAEGYRHHLVESFLQSVEHLLVLLINLIEDRLTLVDRSLLDLCLELGDFLLIRLGSSLHIVANFL